MKQTFIRSKIDNWCTSDSPSLSMENIPLTAKSFQDICFDGETTPTPVIKKLSQRNRKKERLNMNLLDAAKSGDLETCKRYSILIFF